MLQASGQKWTVSLVRRHLSFYCKKLLPCDVLYGCETSVSCLRKQVDWHFGNKGLRGMCGPYDWKYWRNGEKYLTKCTVVSAPRQTFLEWSNLWCRSLSKYYFSTQSVPQRICTTLPLQILAG
jgi:hypothetical protein